MLQGYTMAIVPCGNPTPKKLPTGGGEWPTFRTARAQRAHSARYAPITYAVLGVPNASKGGTKSAAAHKWANSLDNPYHLGGPERLKAGDRIRNGLQMGRLAT